MHRPGIDVAHHLAHADCITYEPRLTPGDLATSFASKAR